jgi:thioredoxin 1
MAEHRTYVTLTEDNFEQEVLKSPGPVLVDFWAAWCGPCRIITPVIEELAGDFTGQVKVAKLDVDRHPRIAGQYGIRSIPSLFFFKDGRVVDQVVGVAPKRVLAEKLQALL